MPHTTTHVVFPIFDGMSHLDFTGPHHVFSSAPDVCISVASIDGRDIDADGFVFSGLVDLSQVEKCDVLCVPGGFGASVAMLNESFMRDIRRLASGAKYVTSVCTGSFILAAAGLLRGRRAATYWANRELLGEMGVIVENERVVRDGNIITGGGVTAGIDFALVTIAEIFSSDVAEAIELRVEYAPAPPFGVGRPEAASPELVRKVRYDLGTSLAGWRTAVDRVMRNVDAA
ncbi:DJ-1/PfpI family protein [Mesorhizobium sp. ZC-5]|uniref:DJ-1/PfpI family protein n=1 Tax=Mesorhizobium sp. ZC-5 TaxID=2986066 RepID=UPI0021E8B858|nr:DJ-1/PfpI family protein [Mesorhizobium sp. ZC-5]MCV3241742.1 DJ-1/PfpI family protein [Mesorhizobium sp. ZC-5]